MFWCLSRQCGHSTFEGNIVQKKIRTVKWYIPCCSLYTCKHYDILWYSSFPGARDVWFSLRNTPYQNNSIVILENIGEDDDALLCITNQTACCQPPYTGALGNWFFPNGSRVPSSGRQWDFHRTRGQMVVQMHRRRGGEEGIYHCKIPDTFGFTQTIYIGVYSASTGEWCTCTPVIKLIGYMYHY